MSLWHLNRLKKIGTAKCAKCFQDFNEHDIIATSTSRRYCYECATQINLVTGKIEKDLNNDKFVPEVSHQIYSIGKKLEINKNVCRLAVLLVITAIKKTNYVSKNKIGFACAAIFLAHKINKQFISEKILPVSLQTLQKNTRLLQKNLTTSNIYTLAKTIHGIKN